MHFFFSPQLSLRYVSFLKIVLIYLSALGLSCGVWDLVPWLVMELGTLALGGQSLSHWTTREVPARASVFYHARSTVRSTSHLWFFAYQTVGLGPEASWELREHDLRRCLLSGLWAGWTSFVQDLLDSVDNLCIASSVYILHGPYFYKSHPSLSHRFPLRCFFFGCYLIFQETLVFETSPCDFDYLSEFLKTQVVWWFVTLLRLILNLQGCETGLPGRRLSWWVSRQPYGI